MEREYINESVGNNEKNNKRDTEIILKLLKERIRSPYYRVKMNGILLPDSKDPYFLEKLFSAIRQFQTSVQGLRNPDGIVHPNGNTILFLGGARKDEKLIVVDLDDQYLQAYEGGRLVFQFHSASGDYKHPTATKPELHHVFRKHADYVSKKYGARMDYAMFFTIDGKAIHQSNLVYATSILKDIGINYFGSHGCVRLSEDNAKALFDWTPYHTPVFVDMH